MKSWHPLTAILFSIFLSTIYLSSAEADIKNSLVIIDTAINSDQPEFAGNIVYEVCILDWYTCPNGQRFMEGKGSAYLPPRFMANDGFNHGTQMVSAAVRTNPNLQIIFIRIVPNSISGSRLNVSQTVVALALKWVSDNKDKFHIGAVAMSQGHHNLSSLIRYCPNDSMVESLIDSLSNSGIPFFVPAGNSNDVERIDWPACYPSSISIGALGANRQIANYGNYDPKLLDYFELGEMKVNDFDGTERTSTGTSISVQVAAAKWMKVIELNPKLSYEERMNILAKSCIQVSNSKIRNGLALPAAIEDPDVGIELTNELDKIRSLLSDLHNLIYALLAALLK